MIPLDKMLLDKNDHKLMPYYSTAHSLSVLTARKEAENQEHTIDWLASGCMDLHLGHGGSKLISGVFEHSVFRVWCY